MGFAAVLRVVQRFAPPSIPPIPRPTLDPRVQRSNPGCRGGAPALARCWRAPRRPNAAVSHRYARAGPTTTRGDDVNSVEAAARVHAEQWPCVRRGGAIRGSIVAMPAGQARGSSPALPYFAIREQSRRAEGQPITFQQSDLGRPLSGRTERPPILHDTAVHDTTATGRPERPALAVLSRW